MSLKLRIGIWAASLALLTGCGPAVAGPAGGTSDVASPPVASSSPARQFAAVTASPTTSATTSPTTSPAAAAVAGADTNRAAPTPARTSTKAPAVHCGTDYYVNSSGNCVRRPVTAPAVPAGATAECNDGTYSFSQHRQGTCSHHGGVKRWL